MKRRTILIPRSVQINMDQIESIFGRRWQNIPHLIQNERTRWYQTDPWLEYSVSIYSVSATTAAFFVQIEDIEKKPLL